MKKILNKNKDLFIILLILILIILFTIFLSQTLTFFTNKIQSSGSIQLGELDYTILVENSSNKAIMPGDEVDLNVKICYIDIVTI